jgi:hypothetical protein
MLVTIKGLILLMLVSDGMGKPVQPPGEAGQAEARPAGWQANEVAETYE